MMLIKQLRKLIEKILLFIVAKKKWEFPKKNKILIVDYLGSKKLSNCVLGHSNFTILHTRQELYYLPILLISLTKFFSHGFASYSVTFIRYVNPNVAITFIDNNIAFPKIMSNFINCKFVMIMNGRRHKTFLEEYKNLKKYKIDKYFVFGDDFRNEVKNKIPNTVVGGSIIANSLFNITRFDKIKKIQYVSLYYGENKKFWKKLRGFDNTFYQPTTKYTLEIIKEFCQQNSLALEIIPRTNLQSEEKYYAEMIDGFIYKKKPNNNDSMYHSYNQLSDDAFAVGCTSTFLMECFGVGYRTGFLTFRQHVIPKNHPENFRCVQWSWPKNTSDYGFFWSNIKEKKYIFNVLNNLLKVNESDWKKIVLPFKYGLMHYDPGNKIIKNYLKSIKIEVN